VVLSNGTGVKGTRVDGATASISSEKFGKGGVEVVGNEGGDDVFIAVGNDKEVMRANCVEIVLPPRTRKYAWLRASGTGSASLCVSIHGFGR